MTKECLKVSLTTVDNVKYTINETWLKVNVFGFGQLYKKLLIMYETANHHQKVNQTDKVIAIKNMIDTGRVDKQYIYI